MIHLTKDQIREKLRTYFADRPEVQVAYLFGSVARGRSGSLSDIDIAVLVDSESADRNAQAAGYGLRAEYISDLMGILHTNDVDLVLLNQAPPLLAHEVLEDGFILFCRNEDLRVELARLVTRIAARRR